MKFFTLSPILRPPLTSLSLYYIQEAFFSLQFIKLGSASGPLPSRFSLSKSFSPCWKVAEMGTYHHEYLSTCHFVMKHTCCFLMKYPSSSLTKASSLLFSGLWFVTSSSFHYFIASLGWHMHCLSPSHRGHAL